MFNKKLHDIKTDNTVKQQPYSLDTPTRQYLPGPKQNQTGVNGCSSTSNLSVGLVAQPAPFMRSSNSLSGLPDIDMSKLPPASSFPAGTPPPPPPPLPPASTPNLTPQPSLATPQRKTSKVTSRDVAQPVDFQQELAEKLRDRNKRPALSRDAKSMFETSQVFNKTSRSEADENPITPVPRWKTPQQSEQTKSNAVSKTTQNVNERHLTRPASPSRTEKPQHNIAPSYKDLSSSNRDKVHTDAGEPIDPSAYLLQPDIIEKSPYSNVVESNTFRNRQTVLEQPRNDFIYWSIWTIGLLFVIAGLFKLEFMLWKLHKLAI